ncbi:ABC transporter substrate-binding protein [Acetobacter conturbans]|uniref:ABC transporter substrate-binding protein n=1 Tax=Acetobacter conturbans TaxID=1737472 RepID=A0ABX0K0N7_9PROT|nr:ABC transporter substrate-binding protein [Acetobacter conturbans]NHN88830.1 ABC transporter substrate-binding protein [Acetobacter conturbans]
MSFTGSSSRRRFLASSLLGVGGAVMARPLWAQEAMSAAGAHGEDCHAAIAGEVKPLAKPRKLSIAWNETSICVAAVPVAKEKGFFARYNIDVDYVNFGGATDQLLEAIATGKADGAPGMALRWLKPLQQGFDVKLVAGLHAGCMYLMVPNDSAIRALADLKGKTVGVTDIGGPDRNFFAIRLKEAGVDPETDVSWRAFPPDLLPLALQRGEVQAISDADPYSRMQRKQSSLRDIDSNMTGAWAHTACCVIGLRGSLVREEPDVARAVTRAILDAGAWVACNPEETGRIFQPFAPKVPAEELAAMIRMQGHHHQALAGSFRDEIVRYAEALKGVGVFRPSLDTTRYAARVTQDLFAS